MFDKSPLWTKEDKAKQEADLDNKINAFHQQIETSYRELLRNKQSLQQQGIWQNVPEKDKRNFEVIERIWQSLHAAETQSYTPYKP